MPTEKSAEHAEPRGSEARAPAVRRTRDYSQRPQKPIKIKPAIARERPSAVTRLGPPREQLAAAKAVPAAPAAEKTRPVEKPAPAVPALLAEDVQRAIVAAARAARVPADEWVARATRAMEAPAEKAISYDEIIVYTLREMNQRLAGLEHRGLGAWLSGLWQRTARVLGLRQP